MGYEKQLRTANGKRQTRLLKMCHIAQFRAAITKAKSFVKKYGGTIDGHLTAGRVAKSYGFGARATSVYYHQPSGRIVIWDAPAGTINGGGGVYGHVTIKDLPKDLPDSVRKYHGLSKTRKNLKIWEY